MSILQKIIFIALLLFLNWFILGFLGFAANDKIQFSLTAIDIIIVIYLLWRSTSRPSVDDNVRFFIISFIGLVLPSLIFGNILIKFLFFLKILTLPGTGYDLIYSALIYWAFISLITYLVLLLMAFCFKSKLIKIKGYLLVANLLLLPLLLILIL